MFDGATLRKMAGAHVLVVDDDPGVGNELENELRGVAVTVHVAQTAAAAIDLLDENSYAVIILDIVLEGGSGFDVLRHARQLELEIPVIVVSAFVPEYVRELLADLQVVRVIYPKPYEAKALAGLVKAWLESL